MEDEQQRYRKFFSIYCSSCGEVRDPASGTTMEAIRCLVGGVLARRYHLVDSASVRCPTTGVAYVGDFCCNNRGHHHETVTNGRDRVIRNCCDSDLWDTNHQPGSKRLRKQHNL